MVAEVLGFTRCSNRTSQYEHELSALQMGNDSLEGLSEVGLNAWDGEHCRNLCGGMTGKTQLEEGHLGRCFCEQT